MSEKKKIGDMEVGQCFLKRNILYIIVEGYYEDPVGEIVCYCLEFNSIDRFLGHEEVEVVDSSSVQIFYEGREV